MENLSNYSDFVNAAYAITALATVGLLVYVVVKYFKAKKKLNAK
jgi:heme exporter protein CcmD